MGFKELESLGYLKNNGRFCAPLIQGTREKRMLELGFSISVLLTKNLCHFVST
jgi:hypothetical protein